MLPKITTDAVENMAKKSDKQAEIKEMWANFKKKQPVFAQYVKIVWKLMKASPRDKRITVVMLTDFLACITDELCHHQDGFYKLAISKGLASKNLAINAGAIFKEVTEEEPERLMRLKEIEQQLGVEYLVPIYSLASKSTDYSNLLLTALYMLRACQSKYHENIAKVSAN